MSSQANDTLTDYQIAFGTPEGKRVLLDLIDQCGILRASFEADPYRTAYNEGRRGVALMILGVLGAKPEDFQKTIEDLKDHV